MNDDSPIPAVLPVVVPSPIGPALSYSAIRAVTSRAETLLDQLGRKVRKPLQSALDDAGLVGAKLEGKVLSRLADRLNPAEALYNELTDLIQNLLAAALAPAIVALEDMTQVGPSSRRFQTGLADAGLPGPATSGTGPPVITPATGPALTRVGSIARQLARSASGVAGGAPPPAATVPACPVPSIADQAKLQTLGQQVADATPPTLNDRIIGIVGNWWNLTDDCCVVGPARSPTDPSIQVDRDHWTLAITAPPEQALAGLMAVVNAWNPKGSGCHTFITPPVDCTKTPLDPACPPDCVKHPEDPRCPPPTDHCPPPCIEVKCPPPIINVPPCPSLTPTSCVQIDLCDWEKFCEKFKKCMLEAKTDCNLDNETAYLYEGCSDRFTKGLEFYLGDQSAGLLKAETLEDAQQPIFDGYALLTAADFIPPGIPV